MRMFSWRAPLWWPLLLCGALWGCKKSDSGSAGPQAARRGGQAARRGGPAAAQRAAPRRPTKPVERHVVLFLGDSLTAGYGLAASEAYPALIDAHWRKHGYKWRAQNAGVSGDTTAGVLRRLDWVLTPKIHTVFLCIGANDGLRGLSLPQMKKNLEKIIQAIQKKGVKVVLAGMMVPPNYGKEYEKKFRQIYVDLAKKYKLKRMPFLLQSVAGQPKLNQADGIHPNAKGHALLRRDVLAFFEKEQILQKQ